MRWAASLVMRADETAAPLLSQECMSVRIQRLMQARLLQYNSAGVGETGGAAFMCVLMTPRHVGGGRAAM